MPDEKLRPATWDDVIRHEAKQARVPPDLALAIAQTESSGDPQAISPKGAKGFFQLMPDTAKELGVDPSDPIQNIRGGLKYFRQQLDSHGGNVEQALQAYNWGPGNVAKGGTPPPETQAYVTKIMGRLKPAAPISKPAVTGNIDLYNRPKVQNADGSVSTVRSMSFNDGGKEILIPTVIGNQVVSDENAIAHYRLTGQHLGMFNDVPSANAYAEQLHNDYAAGKFDKRPVVTMQDMTRNIAQPPPGPAIGAPMEKKPGLVGSLMDSINPMVRTGRRNIAGGIGDAVGTTVGTAVGTALAPFTGGTSLAAGPVVGGTLGAGFAGGLEEYGEQLVGTAPPSVISSEGLTGDRITDAAIEQGGYAVGGRLLAWPIRAAGKRLVATRVGRFASQHFEDVLTGARDALASARTAASDALTAAQDAASGLTASVRQAASAHIDKAKIFGTESVRDATTAAKAGADAVTSRYERIATAPPSVSATTAGHRSQQVIEGPARQAREEIGQMVEQAAQSGPDVDLKPLKAEAQRILSEEIRPQTEAFPRAAASARGEPAAIDDTVEQLSQLASNLTPENMAKMSVTQRAQAEAIHAALAKAQEDQAQTVLKHPAMNVLGRILAAEDKVPFAAAHQFKRELDDAIGTAWDRSVRNRVTNITKVMRGSLRDALSVHEPYNQATKAYQAIAPLYTKGLAPKLRRVAVESPESVVRMIKPKDPTQLRMLRDLLVTQPGRVGKQQEGQFAWDSVRSAWTHDNIIRGSLDGLDARIAKMDPEFLQTMYGDDVGQSVLTNLKAISSAFQQAVEAGSTAVTGAKQRATAGLNEARELGQSAVSAVTAHGRAAVRAEKQAGRQLVGTKISDVVSARGDQRALARSSLRKADKEIVPDVLRASVLGPGSIWGALSTVRLLRGPKSAELVQYAAYSPKGTELLVHALTGPQPGLAMAELFRMTGLGEMVVEGVGTPPATRIAEPDGSNARVGAPPPQ